MRPPRTENNVNKPARPSVYLFRSAAAHLVAGAAAANGSAVTPVGAARRLFGDPVTEKFIHRSAASPGPDLDATNANPMRTLARAVVALGLNAIEASNPAHDYVRPHLVDDAIA